jgi:hypothetical protein
MRKRPRNIFLSKKGLPLQIVKEKIYSLITGNVINMEIPKNTVFYTIDEVDFVPITCGYGRWNTINDKLRRRR